MIGDEIGRVKSQDNEMDNGVNGMGSKGLVWGQRDWYEVKGIAVGSKGQKVRCQKD